MMKPLCVLMLWVMTVDGTLSQTRPGETDGFVARAVREANLTRHLSADRDPAWSPDGRFIAFVSDGDGDFEIYVMKADGSGQTRLTANTAADRNPAWSRDGRQIVFQSNRDGNEEIYRMNADGSQQNWSADGKQIAFVSIREDGQIYVYRMNADGSGPERLTNKPDRVSTPSWSPDGNRIAFSSQRDGNYEVYVVELAG